MSSRVRATLSAHSRPPAMASLRVLPWPPTSTRIAPGDRCWLYRPRRRTVGRARLVYPRIRFFCSRRAKARLSFHLGWSAPLAFLSISEYF